MPRRGGIPWHEYMVVYHDDISWNGDTSWRGGVSCHEDMPIHHGGIS